MNRSSGKFASRTRRAGLVAGVVGAMVVAFALPAGANTGHVYASQSCYTWSVTVKLDNNVSPDHFVEVTTTIPGTTGIVDAHYDTTGSNGSTEIWHESGAAPQTGTVTLTILNADRSVDSTDSASLPMAQDCPTTTTTSTTTTMAPTTTTMAPTTTTTAPESTTTLAAPTTTSTDVAGTTVVSPTTVPPTSPPTEATTSTVGEQGSTIPTVAPTTTTSIQPAGITGELPRTGGGTFFAIGFGLCCLTAGGVLALNRRRRLWTRS